MSSKTMISTSMINFCNSENYDERIAKAKQAVSNADHVVAGAGAGLSTAAGLEYSGKRFTDNMKPFIQKYGFKDMYSAGFYPFETQEERWAYWAKHISLNRYETPATNLYIQLLQLLKEKNYFVITTNVESQFEKAGFDVDKLFEVQGNYGLFQCKRACHDKLYYNEDVVRQMISETVDCRIPASLVPKCRECGSEISPNLRIDRYFVQNAQWYQSLRNYESFLSAANGATVFLELGVGLSTPVIIRYPFEQMAINNSKATLIRLNKDYPVGNKENREATIAFSEDMREVIPDLVQIC